MTVVLREVADGGIVNGPRAFRPPLRGIACIAISLTGPYEPCETSRQTEQEPLVKPFLAFLTVAVGIAFAILAVSCGGGGGTGS